MHLIRAHQVPALTGLSTDQLREWTSRRALIPPDVPANGKGAQALFSWRTVLLLRLAMVLRSRFHVELKACRNLLFELRTKLERVPFHSLWGSAVVLVEMKSVEVIGQNETFTQQPVDLVVLRLDPHLEVLSKGFVIREPMLQLPLFPVVGLR